MFKHTHTPENEIILFSVPMYVPVVRVAWTIQSSYFKPIVQSIETLCTGRLNKCFISMNI